VFSKASEAPEIFISPESTLLLIGKLSKVQQIINQDYSIKAILSAALNSTIDKKLIDIDYYMHIPALDCD